MDRQRIDEFFERIVERRAKRLGISLKEAAKVADETPLFRQAAEELARLEGKTTEQVLAEYRQRLEDGTYPTAECLSVDEVQEYGESGVIPAECTVHLQVCDGCRSLLGVSFRLGAVSVEALLARVCNAP